MNSLTKRFEQAVATARTLTVEQQDLLADELIERARLLAAPATQLSEHERAELAADLAAARRGEFATDGAVAALFDKLGQ